MNSLAASLATAGLLAALLTPAGASAEPPAAPGCVLSGITPGRTGTVLYAAATSGEPVAKLTGAELPLQVSRLGADPRRGRVKMATGGHAPHVRVEGWAPLEAVMLFAARDLPVAGAHVWITAGQKLEIAAAQPDALAVEHVVLGSNEQRARATVPCDAVALRPPRVEPTVLPRQARGYAMKGAGLDLYDRPGGDVVFSLDLLAGAGQSFWSTESRGGFVHVMARSDVTIDAWARTAELSPIRPGELIESDVPSPRLPPPQKLAISEPRPVVAARSPIEIREGPRPEARVIGSVEPGARIYVMESAGDFTNVLPEGLGVLPADGKGFWVPASELPKADDGEPK
ncbi:MAG: hypothetical protein HY744_00415 [Deltaproteobacteria bacterium]|nr:hypothetical protein [Deltaproteobacteria bacterium]